MTTITLPPVYFTEVGSWPLLVTFVFKLRRSHSVQFSHLTIALFQHGLLDERFRLFAVDLCLVSRQRRSKEATGQQIELGTAKHLSFDQLQAIDVAFHRARAPGQRQASGDRVEITTEAFGQPLEGPERALRGLREPLLQADGTPAPQQVSKGLA